MTSALKCLLDHETPLDNVEPSNFQKYELYSLNLLSLCNIDLGINTQNMLDTCVMKKIALF